MDIYPQIVPAQASDASLVSRILIRSFRAGCAVDHRNNPLLVDAWTRRHDTEQIAQWIADPSAHLDIAWLHGRAVGVGMARECGEISLCYVLPEFFRRGVGQCLMGSLETWLAGLGRAGVALYSTVTGQGFYRQLGYRDNGQAVRVGAVPLRPMHKPLSCAALGLGQTGLPSTMQVVVPVA